MEGETRFLRFLSDLCYTLGVGVIDGPKSCFWEGSFSFSILILGFEALLTDNIFSFELGSTFSLDGLSGSILVLKPPDLIIPEGLRIFFWESYTFGWTTL